MKSLLLIKLIKGYKILNKIKYKILFISLVLLLIDILIILNKIENKDFNYQWLTTPNATNDFLDGIQGFYYLGFVIFILICIISYSLSFDNKFSEIGKNIVIGFNNSIKKLRKK